jgi:prolyl oligopeptidase
MKSIPHSIPFLKAIINYLTILFVQIHNKSMPQIKTLSIYLITIFLFLHITEAQQKFPYPELVGDTSVYEKYGIKTIYPFSFLENYEDERTQDWLKGQEKFASNYFAQVSVLDEMKNALDAVHKIGNTKVPPPPKFKHPADTIHKFDIRNDNGRYMLSCKSKLNTKKGNPFWTNPRGIYFFRNELKEKTGTLRFSQISPSPDGIYVAVYVASSLKLFGDIFIIDIKKGKLIDRIKDCTSTLLIWKENGLYYQTQDTPNYEDQTFHFSKNQRICYHAVGTDPIDDQVVFKNPDSNNQRPFYTKTIIDYHTLLVNHSRKIGNKWYKCLSLVDLSQSEFQLKTFLILPEEDFVDFEVVDHINQDSLLIQSNISQTSSQLYLANTNTLNQLSQITNDSLGVLTTVKYLKIPYEGLKDTHENFLLLSYRNHGAYQVILRNFDNSINMNTTFEEGLRIEAISTDLKFIKSEGSETYQPTIGKIDLLLNSFYRPTKKFKIDYTKDQSYGWYSRMEFDYSAYHTQYVEYDSKDGTCIPMYITKKKNIVLNGRNPTLVDVYGGYGLDVGQYFNKDFFPFLAHGGILAVPALRGSGELGNQWEQAGKGKNKPKAIEDLHSAVEYLIEHRYTNPEKIALYGVSHGGFLVASAMAQRPDLFRAVISNVGVHDLTRFNQFLVGQMMENIDEFGLYDTKEDFERVRSISPLQLIEKGRKYPAMFIATGQLDERVPAYYSYMLAAHMQQLTSGGIVLLHNSPNGRHHISYDRESQRELRTRQLAFLFQELGMTFYSKRLALY